MTKRRDLYAYRDKLPFMGRRPGGWWKVKPSGNWSDDYETGRKHAMAFWRVVGGRRTCGLDLSQILIEGIIRPRSTRKRKLSGVEIGFVRTIGNIVDMLTQCAVITAQGPKALQTGKTKVTVPNTRAVAKLAGMFVEASHELHRLRVEEIRKERAAD